MVQNDLTLRLTLLFYQKGYNQYILLYFQSILYLFSTDYPILIFPPILFDHWQHLLYFNAKVCFIDPVQKCDDTYYTLCRNHIKKFFLFTWMCNIAGGRNNILYFQLLFWFNRGIFVVKWVFFYTSEYLKV